MRHCRPSKQRLWLGSGRYFRRGERGHSNADAHCQPDRNRIADSYTATDPNTQSGANGKAAPHASAQAIEFPYWKFLVIGHRCKYFG